MARKKKDDVERVSLETIPESTLAKADMFETVKPIEDSRLPGTIEDCMCLSHGYAMAGNKTYLTYAWNIGKLMDRAASLQKQEWEAMVAQAEKSKRKLTKEEKSLRPYGSGLMKAAAAKYKLDFSSLLQMRQYYRTYPDHDEAIRYSLNWSVQRKLLTIKDDEKRRKFEKKAAEEAMTVQEVNALIDKDKKGSKSKDIEEKELTFAEGKQKAAEESDPVVYYTDLKMTVDGTLAELQGAFASQEKMLNIMFDDKFADEDYQIAKKEALAVCKICNRIRDFLVEKTVPLFDDMTQN